MAVVRGLAVSQGETPTVDFPVEGITDGAIRLRLLADSDLDALVEAVQDPEVPRWTRIPSPYGETEAQEWVVEEARIRESGEGLAMMIVDAETGELLGGIGMVHLHWEERTSEVGYWLARPARGRGVMTRAVRLFSGWIFESLPIDRLAIMASVGNAPSRAVAERAGYRFEGVLRSFVIIKGERHDMAVYSLLRGELQ
jgi:RimJ/RimL family protein N-acetyltransferase